MDKTNIEWCDSTFNPWIGCTKVSPACDNCYAEALMDKRMHKAQWGTGKPRVRTSEANWKLPLRWNRQQFVECDQCGWRGAYRDYFVPNGELLDGQPLGNAGCPLCLSTIRKPARRRVFCASLADVFDNEVDPTWRLDLFDLIETTPNLDWLLLTKRIGNVQAMINARWSHKLPDNVWLGATICNQVEADRDIPKLLAVPARVHFLSIEPMLGPIDIENLPSASGIGRYLDALSNSGVDAGALIPNKLDWVIVGGESGPKARPTHPDWIRSIRDQCAGAGVPFLFKQWGEWAPYDRGRVDSAVLASPKALDEPIQKFGKKLAGHMLDGELWTQFPEARV